MQRKHIALIIAAALMAVAPLTACGPEEEEPNTYEEYNDSTGLEITDSITVIFDGQRWTTLAFTADITQHEGSVYKWADIRAHKPGSSYPAFRLIMYLGKGNHTTYMTFNNPGVGYFVPGTVAGDSQGGAVYYYENQTLHAPDGTNTSDWWPREVTTSVLAYNDTTGELTARVVATMFDYRSWLDHEVLDATACDTRELSITFGGLSLTGGR